MIGGEGRGEILPSRFVKRADVAKTRDGGESARCFELDGSTKSIGDADTPDGAFGSGCEGGHDCFQWGELADGLFKWRLAEALVDSYTMGRDPTLNAASYGERTDKEEQTETARL